MIYGWDTHEQGKQDDHQQSRRQKGRDHADQACKIELTHKWMPRMDVQKKGKGERQQTNKQTKNQSTFYEAAHRSVDSTSLLQYIYQKLSAVCPLLWILVAPKLRRMDYHIEQHIASYRPIIEPQDMTSSCRARNHLFRLTCFVLWWGWPLQLYNLT